MYCVLFKFRQSLLQSIHVSVLENSVSAYFYREFEYECSNVMIESSAYKIDSKLEYWGMSLIYKERTHTGLRHCLERP